VPNNASSHKTREALHDVAARCRDLARQIDLAAKLAVRAADAAVKELDAKDADNWDNTAINKGKKALDAARMDAAEALRLTRYFVKQADWLQERFPDAELVDVPGLVKRVSPTEVAEHDGSLTPGRYVGVAPEEEDEDFDFEETLRAIHIDLKDLNEEAAKLAAAIAKNLDGLLV